MTSVGTNLVVQLRADHELSLQAELLADIAASGVVLQGRVAELAAAYEILLQTEVGQKEDRPNLFPALNALAEMSDTEIVMLTRNAEPERGSRRDLWDLGHHRARFLQDHPERAATLLSALWDGGERREDFWSAVFGGWRELEESDRLLTLLHATGILVLAAPELVRSKALYGLATFIEQCAKKLADADAAQPHLWCLWDKAWEAAVNEAERPAAPGADDDLDQAINEPAGDLAQALLWMSFQTRPSPGAGLPSALHARFDSVINGESRASRLARMVLTSWLSSLHWLDPDWAREELITRLDFGRDKLEAARLWSAYLKAPRTTLELAADLRAPVLDAISHINTLDDHEASNVVRLFTDMAIDHAYSPVETRKALHSLQPLHREVILTHLARNMRAAGDRAAALWRERIAKLLTDYWPADAGAGSAALVLAANRMLPLTREGFPSAVDVVEHRGLIRKLEDASLLLHELSELGTKAGESDYDVIVQHPQEALAWLARIIGPQTRLFGDALSELLKRLSDADGSLREANAFRALRDRAL
jgi:hypothetical protein